VARIVSIEIPNHKRVEIGLLQIYGIGRATSKKILNDLKIDANKKVGELSSEELQKLQTYISDKCKVEGDLRRELSADIKRLMDIGCYRGLRHRKNLPVHGQRTKTNAQTRKRRSGRRRSFGR